jgi:sulfur-oxidizing protein SoxY
MLVSQSLRRSNKSRLPVIINELRVWQDDRLVLAMEGGISISEDTKIRFTHVPNGRSASASRQRTPGGHLFQNEWRVDGSGF